jgi:hypothetical protein
MGLRPRSRDENGTSGKAIGLDTEPGMIDYMNADAKMLNMFNYESWLLQLDDPEMAPQWKSFSFVTCCTTLVTAWLT